MENAANNIEDIYSLLSDEEKTVLQKIESKIVQFVDQEKKKKYAELEAISDAGPDFSEKHPDIIHKKHITDFPKEMLFTLKAEVTELDNQGNISGVVELIEKFYHIPIQANEDHKPYLDNFLTNFHKTLENTCQVLNKFDGQQ